MIPFFLFFHILCHSRSPRVKSGIFVLKISCTFALLIINQNIITMGKVLVRYRNSQPIEVEENSVTHMKALNKRGNWSLVNDEGSIAKHEEKKSVSEDALAAESNEADIPQALEETNEQAPATVHAPKPKGKGGRKKAETK